MWPFDWQVYQHRELRVICVIYHIGTLQQFFLKGIIGQMLFLLPTGWPTSFFSVLLFFSFSQKIVFVWGCESAGFTAPVSSSCRFPLDLWLLHSLGSLPTCLFKVRLSHPLFTNSYNFSLASCSCFAGWTYSLLLDSSWCVNHLSASSLKNESPLDLLLWKKYLLWENLAPTKFPWFIASISICVVFRFGLSW